MRGRGPENPRDPRAIHVQTKDDTKIGYIPRQDSVIFARLMDAGKLLFDRIMEKELRGSWLGIYRGCLIISSGYAKCTGY
ncbi:MAG: HIRAN domain-containing protein [Bacillota bacterium]|nr:HIRAN domain-containing protein [Bacillota bacterium]